MTTPDAGTADQAPQKTLEDIRREIDADYPGSTTEDRLGKPDTAELLAPRLRTPPSLDEDEMAVEPPRPVPRRDAGRRGHVMAAAIGCIAGQVLLVVAYVAVPRVDPQLEALRTHLDSLAVKLEGAESRVTGAESRVSRVESRVSGVESSVRRLGDDVASAAVRTRQVEDAVSAPRQIAAKPAPLPPARAPVTAMDSERWIPSEHVAPPSLPPPHQVRPQAEAIVPSAKDPTTHSAPSSAARVPSDNASSSNTPPTLMDKLRGDWRTIKQGFATAGDDFKTNMRDLARRVRVRGE